MTRQLTSNTSWRVLFYDRAKRYLKRVYLIDPIDMDYTEDTAAICLENGEQPEDEIERRARKYDLVKHGQLTDAEKKRFLEKFDWD